MSLFFVNALADPARQFFLTHCSSRMPFDQITSQKRRYFNSESRKLRLQSDMDSLNLSSFMNKHNVSDYSQGLAKRVNHINALAPELPQGFGDDAHKTRHLRRAIRQFLWALNPIAQLTTSRYTFVQFITALNESLQLKEELYRAYGSDMLYGQCINDTRDVSRHRSDLSKPSRWFPSPRGTSPKTDDSSQILPAIDFCATDRILPVAIQIFGIK